MPTSYYDRFADTRIGGAITKWALAGIDKKPSFLQRAGINTLISAAYLADAGMRGYKRTQTQADIRRYLEPLRKQAHSKTMGHRGGRWYAAARMGNDGVARVRGKGVRRTLKHYPKAVRASRRAGDIGALHIGHEMHSELRTLAGGQGVVTLMAERLLPSTLRDGSLCESINREDGDPDAPLDVSGRTAYPFDVIPAYAGAGQDVTTDTTINHRQDWTMFTNGSWRDGYAYANGNLSSAGTATAGTGYTTPGKYGNRAGNPTGWNTFTAVNQTVATSSGTADSLTLHPGNTTGANDTQLGNYYHLHESISWKLTNNAALAAHVTIYECVLVRDIATKNMASLNDNGVTALATKWGGLPCPLELWRQSREVSHEPYNAGDLGATGVTHTINAGERETRGVCSAQLGRDPTSNAAAGGIDSARDIDAANVTPDRAHLLHTWYRLIPHTRVIPPGASTTITIKVNFNRRIPGAWWNNFYAIGGLTRCFFMVSAMDYATGVTGITEAAGVGDAKYRRRVMAPTDLMVSWTKRKSVARTRHRIRPFIYVKAAMPEVDAVVMRNPATGGQVDVDEAMEGNEGGGAGAGGTRVFM